MFWFITMLLSFSSAITFFRKRELTWVGEDEKAHRTPLRGIAVFFLLFGLFAAFFAFTTRVEAKQVGVLTTLGSPSDKTYGSGPALRFPWQKMTQIDATTQTNEYHGDNAIKVILTDKNTADISATIRWAVNPTAAHEVYSDFRSNDPTEGLNKAVVSTQFKAAMNYVFNSYDATAENNKTPATLAKHVEDIMSGKTNGLVDIKSVTISYIKPDKAVQRKIDALQTQRGATKVAEEKKATARAEAEANEIISKSISNDPNVLVSKCLDLLGDGAFQPPAGFSCWSGGGGSVVIPATKQ